MIFVVFRGSSVKRRRKLRTTAGFISAIVLLFAQIGGQALTTDPLSYGGGILVTGNYVVGAVDFTETLNPPDSNGISTGTIPMSGVPVDADIVEAYLFFEAITYTASPSQASLNFRGHDIDLNDPVMVRKDHQDLQGNVATCWTSGTPVTMWRFRVDVLQFLPVRLDKNNQPTIKRLVNDADLTAQGESLHIVKLPTRNGNQLPESGGANLVVVYRVPSEPLRKIVFYDGIHIQESLTDTMTQTLRGFYKSSATKSAKITFMVGSGQPNNNERFFFNDGTETKVSPNNPAFGGSSSERAWSALTYDVSNLMNPGNNSSGGFGETAIAKIDHSAGGGDDCLTWEGVVFSTAVADTDPNSDGGPLGDGLPDGLEDATNGLTDADGQPLPNLNAMGASSSHRDLFVEFNATWAAAETSWGSASAPYDATNNIVTLTDHDGHHHLPTPEVLKLMGDAYAAHGITAHFDVGPLDNTAGTCDGVGLPTCYHSLGVVPHTDWVDDYTSTDADGYLVPTLLARGGEIIKERACDTADPQCQFPDYPGTVYWKLGLKTYRDFPVRDHGEELNYEELTDPANPGYFDWNAGTHRRRFDRNRFGLVHYVLNAHLNGRPKSLYPCLVNGQPASYDANNGTACTTNNPQFHIPTSQAGVADVPGVNAMVTLGRWDEFVGKPFVRASTTFHEIGHNLNLFHGGLSPVWGNKAPNVNTATYIEPNCKPTYLSSMSYLFIAHGLLTDDDTIHLDYSSVAHQNINEAATPSDVSLSPGSAFRPAWFAPANSPLATSLGVPAATRFCNGLKFDPNAPPASMARVYTDLSADLINWDGYPNTNTALPQQDINFDSTLSNTLSGFNDWANVRLNQTAVTSLKVSGDTVVIGSGPDYLGFGPDGLGFGPDGLGFGPEGLGFGPDGLGFGPDGLGFGPEGLGFGPDMLGFGPDGLGFANEQDLSLEGARGFGRSAPWGLKVCIITSNSSCSSAAPFDPQYHKRALTWQAPTFGHTFLYHISRKRGGVTSTYPYVLIGTSSTTSFVDIEQLPDGMQFTYKVRAEFDDETPHPFSGFSKPVTITAVNDAPVANADPNYTTPKGKQLKITTQAAGVLGNDTDVDSPASFLRAVKVTGPTSGTLDLNADGTFTFTPQTKGFTGVVTFTYKANNGVWSADNTVPLSGDSSVVTVTITVLP
jgi:hypothetical protein